MSSRGAIIEPAPGTYLKEVSPVIEANSAGLRHKKRRFQVKRKETHARRHNRGHGRPSAGLRYRRPVRPSRAHRHTDAVFTVSGLIDVPVMVDEENNLVEIGEGY